MKVEFTTPVYYTWSDFSFHGLDGRRYVVFDCESTGIDHATESITQMGAIAVYGSKPSETESFCSYAKPWKSIPPKIEALTGVTNEIVSQAEGFPAVFAKFREFCADAVLVTQCGYKFDFPALATECRRFGLPELGNVQLDTKAIFAYLHREREEIFSTDFLSDYYGVDRSQFKRHDALGDAKLISHFFCGEIAEAKRLGIESIVVGTPIAIKRFVLSASS